MKEINGIKIFESEIEIIGIYFSRAIVERILRVIVLCLIPLTIVLILKKSSYDLVLSILTTIFMLGFFIAIKAYVVWSLLIKLIKKNWLESAHYRKR